MPAGRSTRAARHPATVPTDDSLNAPESCTVHSILMATNTVVGFAWREAMGGGVAVDAWNYWWVCVPIVAFGAPFGAKFISRRGRLFLVGLLIFVILA